MFSSPSITAANIWRPKLWKVLPQKNLCKVSKNAIIDSYGIPMEITTDQGTQITNNLAQDFFAEHGICHTTSFAYHQQADGLAECGNKSIFGMISQVINPLCKQKDRANRLPAFTNAYNSSQHASMKYIPFFLHHGFEFWTKLEQLAPLTPEIPKTTKDRQQIVDAQRADPKQNLLASCNRNKRPNVTKALWHK